MSVAAAIQRLQQLIEDRITGVAAFRAIVTGVSGGLVTIRRLDATTADTKAYASVAGFDVAVDDEVLCIPLGGQPVIVGRILRSGSDWSGQQYVKADSQLASDTATSTDTTNYVDAMTFTLAVPNGTYTVTAVGSILAQHSATDRVTVRTQVEATALNSHQLYCPNSGDAYNRLEASGTSTPFVVADGGLTAYVKYRPHDAGTATVTNPSLLVIATRIG